MRNPCRASFFRTPHCAEPLSSVFFRTPHYAEPLSSSFLELRTV
ncbi:hypothetical protein EVA_06649 [gut metagenome]|uniref:Uncharacterized protein n=1 Tax=gut metagenome TaxID=749906 RepID=J9GEB6_9ZZZZ